MIGNLRDLAIFVAGGLVFSGLWMFDELLTEAMYCKISCLYPIPLIGSFTLYGAEGIAWLLIIGGFLLYDHARSKSRFLSE